MWRCVLGQDSSSAHALCPPRSEWVPGLTVIAVCLNSYQHCDGSRAVCSSGLGVELVLERTGPIARRTTVKATIIQSLAASCLNLPSQIQKYKDYILHIAT